MYFFREKCRLSEVRGIRPPQKVRGDVISLRSETNVAGSYERSTQCMTEFPGVVASNALTTTHPTVSLLQPTLPSFAVFSQRFASPLSRCSHLRVSKQESDGKSASFIPLLQQLVKS